MVGFGSSLRIARRRGWEAAYLNYETLKLFLTQIEAVYEEESRSASTVAAATASSSSPSRRSSRRRHLGFGGIDNEATSSNSKRRRRSRRSATTTDSCGNAVAIVEERRRRKQSILKADKTIGGDFRDELFLVSNSSDAFPSESDTEEERRWLFRTADDSSSDDYSSTSSRGGDNNDTGEERDYSQQGDQLQNLPTDSFNPGKNVNEKLALSRSGNPQSHHHRRRSSNVSHGRNKGGSKSVLPSNANFSFSYNHDGIAGIADESLSVRGEDITRATMLNDLGHNFNHDQVRRAWMSQGRNSAENAPILISDVAQLEINDSQVPFIPKDGFDYKSNLYGSEVGQEFSFLGHEYASRNDGVDSSYGQNNNFNETYPSLGSPNSRHFPAVFPSDRSPNHTLYGFSNNTYDQLQQHHQEYHLSHQQQSQGTALSNNLTSNFLGVDTTATATAAFPATTDLIQTRSAQNLSHSPTLLAPGHSPKMKLGWPRFGCPSKRLSRSEKRSKRQERVKQRRQKRLIFLLREKKRRRKVPPHLRAAHAKARAITERFLGLLRAEVEKVTLFAHSRMGELADTIGSLRFPSYDDDGAGYLHHHDSHGGGRVGGGGQASFEHSLSDGGMHPSASSSSDDMIGRSSWSDDSSLDNVDNSPAPSRRASPLFGRDWKENCRMTVGGGDGTTSKAAVGRLSSLGTPSADSRQKRNRRRGELATSRRHNRHHRPSHYSPQSATPIRQQIQQSNQLRVSRPMFQRSDHVVGEDFLLLSAVDEADAYVAVGVELMHLLRFICVNIIAVRKLCKKHDRLLLNRMLGGYYHRHNRQYQQYLNGGVAIGGSPTSFQRKEIDLRTPRKKNRKGRRNDKGVAIVGSGGRQRQGLGERKTNDQELLGGILLNSAVDATNSSSATGNDNSVGFRSNKLVGTYDVKIQLLANSTTVQMVSSSLALALSEYEVSRCRADALSRLNETAESPQRGGVIAYNSLEADDDLCQYFPKPRSLGLQLTPLNFRKADIGHRDSEATKGKNECFEVASSQMSRDGDEDLPSTSSSVSLTRLQFVVASVFGLREAARIKRDPFHDYLSRVAMTFTGTNVVGEGLDGCSRETLDFFVMYQPDAALFFDSSSLRKCLQVDQVYGDVSEVMISCLVISAKLADGTPQYTNALNARNRLYTGDDDFEFRKFSALAILPHSVAGHNARPTTATDKLAAEYTKNRFVTHRAAMRMNLSSAMLYAMNYYIVMPSTLSFSCALGGKPVHAALLIGAASLTSLLSAMFQSFILSKSSESTKAQHSVSWFIRPFLITALFPLFGNLIYSFAYQLKSIPLAVVGRLLVGLSYAEVINRQFLLSCTVPVGLVQEAANLAQAPMLGTFLGFLVGASLELFDGNINLFGKNVIANFKTLPGYIMTFLWLIQIVGIVVVFREGGEKERTNRREKEFILTTSDSVQRPHMSERDGAGPTNSNDVVGFSSVHVTDDQNRMSIYSESMLRRSSSDVTKNEDLHSTYYGKFSADAEPLLGEKKKSYATVKRADSSKSLEESIASSVRIQMKKKPRGRTWTAAASRFRKIVFHSIALPVTIALLLFVKLTIEVLYSSCGIIAHRYFGWSGSSAGYVLAFLAALVFPANVVASYLARRRNERRVIKNALSAIGVGVIIMANYEAMVVLFLDTKDIFETDSPDRGPTTYYDWSVGIIPYIIGLIIAFTSSVVLEGVTLSLMSKVSPTQLNDSATNCGLIATMMGPLGRMAGDVLIMVVGLSHRIINTDIVNSLTFFLFCFCCAGYYIVRRHYFFLIGS